MQKKKGNKKPNKIASKNLFIITHDYRLWYFIFLEYIYIYIIRIKDGMPKENKKGNRSVDRNNLVYSFQFDG